MKCPACMSTNNYVTESISKDKNYIRKCFNLDDVPYAIERMDYRLRRHKCRDCGRPFFTVETYYDSIDIENYLQNEAAV